MILGVGNDIVEIDRISEAIAKFGDRFLHRIFTDAERAYCQSHHIAAPHFAGRFAAKEAIVKAFGVGFKNGLSWKDIGVDRGPLGQPLVVLSAKARELLGDPQCLITISHCRDYAMATALWISIPNVT